MKNLAALFYEKVAAGLSAEKQPPRNTFVPNAVDSEQWNKLITIARTKILQALSEDMEDAEEVAKSVVRDGKVHSTNRSNTGPVIRFGCILLQTLRKCCG